MILNEKEIVLYQSAKVNVYYVQEKQVNGSNISGSYKVKKEILLTALLYLKTKDMVLTMLL